MPLRFLSALALASICWGATPAGFAQDGPIAPEKSLDRGEVRTWLMRLHEAASHRNFHGTFVVSAGGSVTSARIAHYCDGRNQFERIDTLDGELRRIFRRNDIVHTVWPQSRVAVVEQREQMSSFPALLQGGDDRIADSYDVRSRPAERVAGHDANVLHLKPRDDKRFAHRLWADKATGLLLRAEIIGERGEVLESSAFSEVTIDGRPQPESATTAMGRLDGYRVLRPSLVRTQLDAEGWNLPAPVSGFRQVTCVKRPLEGRGPVAAAADEVAAPQVLQSIFSDGVTYVSVFIEPYDPRRHPRSMRTASGATHTLMQRTGDSWVTVVGDVPTTTLELFAQALQRRH